MTSPHAPAGHPPKVVYRRVALAVSAFDHIKAWQRWIEQQEGRRLSNGELIDRLVLSVPLPSLSGR
ncbi:hypothetical protein G4Q83_09845 [Xanthomonas theicola]|nr:hypothetical protein G4Q83_09845 [Xanthomonas theicola]